MVKMGGQGTQQPGEKDRGSIAKDPKELNNIVNTSPVAEELKSKLKPRVRRWIKK